jgi:branched-chain amino acid transport system permease protein
MDRLLPIIVAGLGVGSVYSLVALGLTMIYRSTTVMNFAHGQIFMVGAVISLLLIESGWPYVLAIVCAVAAAFVIGVLIEKVALERLLHADHVVLVFATVAIGFIIVGAVRYFGFDQRGMPPLVGGTIHVGGSVVEPQYLVTLGALAIISAGFAWVFLRTGVGRVARASTQSLRGAGLVGINVHGVFATMWGVGCAVAALGGILAAPMISVSPDIGNRPLILGFAVMALGGFGSFLGAVVGGLILGVVEKLAAFYVSTTLGDAIGFVVILLVLLIRPSGLFGAHD